MAPKLYSLVEALNHIEDVTGQRPPERDARAVAKMPRVGGQLVAGRLVLDEAAVQRLLGELADGAGVAAA